MMSTVAAHNMQGTGKFFIYVVAATRMYKKQWPPHVKKAMATACKNVHRMYKNAQPISRSRWPNARPGWPIFQEAASSQKCLHRNSVQNGPLERSTALTGATFVTISVFMSRGPFSKSKTACKKRSSPPHMKKTSATVCIRNCMCAGKKHAYKTSWYTL